MSWSRLLLLAITVSLPLIRPAGPQQTALTDALLIVLVLWAWPRFWRARQTVRFPLLGPQWLILVGSLIATLGSAYTIDCIVTSVQDVYIYIWFVTLCNVLEWEDLPWLGQIWVVTSTIEAGLIVMGAFAHVGVLANEWGRGVGTFVNPNMAASYLVTSFFVYLATPFPRSRLLRVVVGALLLVAILATGSNAALPALAVGLAVLGVYRLIIERRPLEPWLGLAALAAALLCLLVLLGLPTVGPAALGQLRGSGELLAMTVGRLGGGIASRIQIWTGAWVAFQQNPVGLGPGVSSVELGGELHNDFLSHLVERGVLGLAGLVWAVVATFAHLAEMVRVEYGRSRQLALATHPVGPERKGPLLGLLEGFRTRGPDWVGPLLAGFAAALPFMLSHEILHFRHYWVFLALIFTRVALEPQTWRQAAARSWAWVLDPHGKG